MTRIAALVSIGLLGCAAAPAFAQSNSELAGAPGWRTAGEEAASRAEARKQVEEQIAKARAETKRKADQAAAAQKQADAKKVQADARKAEQARLAKQAEDLKVREARLKAREQELAAERDRLAQLRAEIEDRKFEDRQEIADASGEPADAPLESPAPDDRPFPMRLDASIRSCAFAGEDKALARDYFSARYVRPPRFYERQNSDDDIWQLRGVMRIEDRRGYLLADTVCELDRDGRVQHFAFLRSD